MNDLFEARVERDKGIKKATDHASHEFIERARHAVNFMIRNRVNEFTADDVWDVLTPLINSITSPADPRALGGVLRALQAEKLIEPTGRYVQSRRRHAAPIMVWKIF